MTTRRERQTIAADFIRQAFGDAAAALPQRGVRFLEEAIELAQAAQVPREMALKLVDFVYSRPVGEIGQEFGGVDVTLLGLAEAAGFCAEECEVTELHRVLSKPLTHWAKRNEAKNDAGFDLTKRDGS